MPFPVVRQFGDAGGLAHPIDTHNQQHAQLALGCEHLRGLGRRDLGQTQDKLFLQQPVEVFGVAGIAQLDLVSEDLDELIGRLDAHISLQQKLFELVPQRVVDGSRRVKNRSDSRKNTVA